MCTLHCQRTPKGLLGFCQIDKRSYLTLNEGFLLVQNVSTGPFSTSNHILAWLVGRFENHSRCCS